MKKKGMRIYLFFEGSFLDRSLTFMLYPFQLESLRKGERDKD